ncbi:MAG: flagellar biosynthesis protein FlhF [Bacillota bacterium]
MRIKRYIARDMQEAVSLIKQDMGPEAVIVSSRRVRGNGLLGFLTRQLEVTAAMDEPETKRLAGSAGERGVVQAGGHDAFTPFVTRGASLSSDHQVMPPRDAELKRDLSEVKSLLHRLSGNGHAAANGGLLKWRRFFSEMEVEEEIITELIAPLEKDMAPDHLQQDEVIEVLLLNRITQMVEPNYGDSGAARVVLFVGPTGVGKTTTLAKLAAQYRLFYEKDVTLVTIDTYRIGAVEQLKSYAEIIGIPLEVVMTPAELSQVLHNHAHADFILIDSAGRPSKNIEQVLELKRFIDAITQPHDVYLVLSCNTKYRDLLRVAEDFGRLNYNKLIFTKLDETESPGVILNLIYRLGLPAVYVTDGQSVPDDIESLYPKKVAKLLLKGGERNAGSGA